MRSIGITLLIIAALVSNVYAEESKHESPKEENKCIGAGPQAPRDIDSRAGTNIVIFDVAPAIDEMNICNIQWLGEL